MVAAPLTAAAYLTRVSTRSMNSRIHIQTVTMLCDVITDNVDITTVNGAEGEMVKSHLDNVNGCRPLRRRYTEQLCRYYIIYAWQLN